MSLARPLGVKIILPILLVLSAVSLPSGALLLSSPDGSAMGAQVILPHLTQQIPIITDFAPVGLFLLVVYGLVPLVLMYGLWTRMKLAWDLTLLLGATEVAWIVAEVVMFYDLGFFVFYPIIVGMGAGTLLLCLLPSVRRFYSHGAERTTR